MKNNNLSIYIGWVLLHLPIAFFMWLVDDEAYYWVWSRQLDWGYFDHPPMVALFIKLGYFLFPNKLGVRLLSLLSFVVFLFIWKKILQPKTPQENRLFYCLFLSFAAFQIFGLITTPDVPLLLMGSFYLWSLQKFINNYQRNYIWVLALSMALVMYSKYFGVFLIGFSLLPLIPILYKKKEIYLVLLLALLLYAPHLWWQYQHDWVSIRYHFIGRNSENYFSLIKSLNYITGLLALGSWVVWPWAGKALGKAVQSQFQQSLQWIVVGSLLIFFLLSFTHKIQAQWNLIIYLAWAPLLYYYFQSKPMKKGLFKLLYIQIGMMVLIKIMLAIPTVKSPMLALYNFVINADSYVENQAVFERYQQTAAYQFYVQKPAYCYKVYNHRASQYDVWKNEEQLQNQDFTSFSLERFSQDTLLDNYNKYESVHQVHDFVSFPKVKFTPTYTERTPNSLYIDCQIYNPYNEDIVIDASHQQIILIGFNSEKHPNYTTVLNTQKMVLTAESSEEYSFQLQITLPENFEIFALGLQPPSMSGKKQSDYFTLKEN